MEETIVRYMQQEDSEQVESIVIEIINGIPYYNDLAKKTEINKYTSNKLKEKILDDPKSVILAIQRDTIIGFCFSRFDDYIIWLEWFGVLKEFRSSVMLSIN